MIALAIAWSLVTNFLLLLFALLFTCPAQWDCFAGMCIHGFGKLNVSKVYKGEETFSYTLLQSSLICTIEKTTIVHCCSVCYAMLYGEKCFFPLLAPVA